jgi:hypothetical protein
MLTEDVFRVLAESGRYLWSEDGMWYAACYEPYDDIHWAFKACGATPNEAVMASIESESVETERLAMGREDWAVAHGKVVA